MTDFSRVADAGVIGSRQAECGQKETLRSFFMFKGENNSFVSINIIHRTI